MRCMVRTIRFGDFKSLEPGAQPVVSNQRIGAWAVFFLIGLLAARYYAQYDLCFQVASGVA